MQCQFIKADGSRCRGTSLPGKTLCVFHDPERAAARAEGRRRGGVNRSRPAAVLPSDTPPLPLRTPADVILAIEDTFNAVRSGRLAHAIGNALGYLAATQLRAIEVGHLAERVAVLEENARHGERAGAPGEAGASGTFDVSSADEADTGQSAG